MVVFVIVRALNSLFNGFFDLCAIDELSIHQHSKTHEHLKSHLDPRI